MERSGALVLGFYYIYVSRISISEHFFFFLGLSRALRKFCYGVLDCLGLMLDHLVIRVLNLISW